MGDEFKIWGDMTKAERQALVGARERGEPIEQSQTGAHWSPLSDFWHYSLGYRVKPSDAIGG